MRLLSLAILAFILTGSTSAFCYKCTDAQAKIDFEGHRPGLEHDFGQQLNMLFPSIPVTVELEGDGRGNTSMLVLASISINQTQANEYNNIQEVCIPSECGIQEVYIPAECGTTEICWFFNDAFAKVNVSLYPGSSDFYFRTY